MNIMPVPIRLMAAINGKSPQGIIIRRDFTGVPAVTLAVNENPAVQSEE